MYRKIFEWMHTHERHLSALAMIAGFVVDNLFFNRIDLWQTQSVFAMYTAICFVSIPFLHWIEARSALGVPHPRWSVIFLIMTQFALGGFWSGFVIFYWRSAVFGASWPFLLILILVFLGSEYFHHYHDRLVFTSTLFFFALYSYAIFAVPIYTGTIGVFTFLGSGLVAIFVFSLFVSLLRKLGRERFLGDVWRIRTGAIFVFILINVSYFMNILPPLPLSAAETGVYHSVWNIPNAYFANAETNPWFVRYLGFTPTLHIAHGETLSAYSSVFAPTSIKTKIVHRWQWYDQIEKKWITKAIVSYSIFGGRDGGYRGYSTARMNEIGKWRVDVETTDGRLIARLPFKVELVEVLPLKTTITLD